jgi:fibronectin-binding autotransporter adhesin
MKIRLLFVILGVALLVSSRANAQTTAFNMSAGNWSSGANWTNGTPVAADTVNFTTTATSTVDGAFSMTILDFGGGVQIVNSSLGSINVSGSIDYSGGISVALNVPISGTGNFYLNGGTGTVTLNPGVGSNTFSGITNVFANGTLADGENNSFSPNSELYVGGSSAGTVDVNFNETVSALGLSTAANGTINIASGKTLTINGGISDTFIGVIAGSGNLQKLGSSTQILTGTNTYTGTTTVGSGADIQIGNGTTAGTLASSGVSGAGGLSFAVPSGSTTTYSGTLSGTLGVATNVSTGTTNLSGTNTYSGATTVNMGTLQAGSTSAFGGASGMSAVTISGTGTLDLGTFSNTIGTLSSGSSTSTVILGSGATLTLGNPGGSSSYNGEITGAGSLNMAGYQLFLMGSTSNYTGTTTISSGTLAANNTSGYATGDSTSITIMPSADLLFGQNNAAGAINPATTITDNGAVQFFRTDNITFSNSISGTGDLDKFSTGTVQLTGSNTYSGTTTLSSGTLQAGATNVFSSSSRVSFNGTATLDLNNFNEAIGSFDGSSTGSITLGTAALTVTNGLGVQFDGVISGTGSMVYSGGSSIVTGTNTYSGGTTITNGSLLVAGAGSGTGSGPITITPTGTLYIGAASNTGFVGAGTITDNGLLEFNRSDMPTFTTVITGTGGVQANGGGAYLTANDNYSGGTTINAGDISVGDGSTVGARITGNVYVAPGAALQFQPAAGDNYTFTGAISGAGSVTFSGPGAITLQSPSNTYSGTTYVNGGNLSDNSPNAFSPNSNMLVNSTGSLTVNHFETVANLENGGMGGPVSIAATSFLTSLGNAYSGDFMGTVSGLGGIVVSSGQQGFSGNNTYSGGTLVSGNAELWVGSNTALGTGTLTFSGSSTEMSPDINVTLGNAVVLDSVLDNDDGGNNNLTLTGQVSGPNEIEWCTPGTLELTNTGNTFSGGIDMREGTLIVPATGTTSTGTITLDTTSALNVMSGATVGNPLNFSGTAAVVTGSGTISTAVVVNSAVVVSPMASPGGGPGTLTFSNGLTLASGGTLNFDIYNATGTPGSGFSLISSTGGLGLSLTPGSFMINIDSTNSSGTAASAINFNAGLSYSWQFAASPTAITGTTFNSNLFNLVTAGNFFNSTGGGTFGVTEVGNSLYLNFTPVPEPSTWALMGAGILALVPFGLRRRRSAKA